MSKLFKRAEQNISAQNKIKIAGFAEPARMVQKSAGSFVVVSAIRRGDFYYKLYSSFIFNRSIHLC